ncbi:MAG TPA: GatB/YqeY domain-containing protein [Vicinamibacteria bacterium]|jgi:uncharacterized protein YqeY
MSLKDRLDQDLKTAMREKAQLRLDTIRMLKSAIKYREIELMKPLDEAGIHAVIASEVKRRRDAAEQYRAGHRPELADKEDAETAILQGYLPQQLSQDELRAKVDEAVKKVGAAGMKDMGAVMKALMPEVQGRAEGKAVSDMVKARLSGK